jgi:hypothetical protein
MDNIPDSVKVMGANAIALGASFTSLENGLRLAGLSAAFLYTILKIAHLIKNWRNKENNG